MSFPSSKKPGKPAKPGEDPAAEQKPDVIPGDEIFFNHPSGPLAGKVVCVGEHGATIRVGNITHKIKWPHILGHKKRQPQGYQIEDSGEDGHIVVDADGKRRYLAVPNEAHEDQLVAKAEPPGSTFGGRPGLTKKVITEKTGKKNTHWVKTGEEAKKPRRTPGLREVTDRATGKKFMVDRFGVPVKTPEQAERAVEQTLPAEKLKKQHPQKHGDRVTFTAGDFHGSGTIDGQPGKDGAYVKDKSGRRHQVRWDEIHPDKPEYAERGKDESDKAYAKRAVDTQPPVQHLPEEHDKYFERDANTKTVPVENLHSTKSDAENKEGGENAPKRMLAAYHGKLGKRPPISVAAHPDKPGHFKVLDGNATYTAAKQMGWKDLPVQVVNEADHKAKEIAKQIFNPADPEYKHLPKKAVQPVNDEQGLIELGKAGLEELKKWLDQGRGVASQLGFKTMTKGPDDVTPEEWLQPGSMLFIAANKCDNVKGLERARDKVKEYGGNWNRLTDMVRCTMAVDNLMEMHKVVRSLKATGGLKVAQVPKNRFLTPTDEGYMDINLIVTMPNGIQAEVQLNVKDMLRAKKIGHKPFEVTRSLESKHAGKPSTDWPPEEAKQWQEAYDEQVKIYGEAYLEHIEKHYGGDESKMVKSMRQMILLIGGRHGVQI